MEAKDLEGEMDWRRRRERERVFVCQEEIEGEEAVMNRKLHLLVYFCTHNIPFLCFSLPQVTDYLFLFYLPMIIFKFVFQIFSFLFLLVREEKKINM